MSKFLTVLAGATALTVAIPAQAATLFSIDLAGTSVSVGSNPTACIFGNCELDADLATLPSPFSLEVGESRTFDFANIFVDSGFGVGSATLDATLAFLTPGGSASTGGEASYFRFGGIFTPGVTGGSLTWNTPVQSVTAGDGSSYTVRFGDLTGVQFGSSSVSQVTVTLDSMGAAVPEPATWAFMILGFGAVGAAMRRRKPVQTTVRFA